MLSYLAKRILFFIPTLIIITLVGFALSVSAPGDPVERMVTSAQSNGEIGSQTKNQLEQRKFWGEKLGLNLPLFYFTISSYSRPDTLYKIFDRSEREALDRLIGDYGNWELISDYYKRLSIFNQHLSAFSIDTSYFRTYNKDSLLMQFNQVRFDAISLRSCHERTIIEAKSNSILHTLGQYPFLASLMNEFQISYNCYLVLENAASVWKNYIPIIRFYGMNQYHRWLFGDGNWLTGANARFSKGLLRGDFGISYMNKQPVGDIIGERFRWSLFFNIISIVLAYLISIPIGVKAAANKGGKFDKRSSIVLFVLYSLPGFWIATLLLMTFANPDMLAVFPASGVEPVSGMPDDIGFFHKVLYRLPYLVLPTICYTYSSVAFISRTMRVSMIDIINLDYIRTARAKGLPEKTVIWKHAFRNSLLPIITIFVNIFPAAIGGSVVLETIFTIPGMGSEIIIAIQNNNYPMIFAVFTITGVLTLTGFLISDILYAIADPRISYGKK